MDTVQFCANLVGNKSIPEIEIEIRVDGNTVEKWQCSTNPQQITLAIPEVEDQPHVISFEMTGKLQDHTKLDQENKITDDVLIRIDDFQFDGIHIDQIVFDHAVYTHDFNGSGPSTQSKFVGVLGCNGTVDFSFRTPVYLWLLENM